MALKKVSKNEISNNDIKGSKEGFAVYNDIVLNGRFCGVCDVVVAAPTMLVPLSALFGTPVLTWCRIASWVDLGTKKYPWFNNVHRIYCENNADKGMLANLILEKLRVALRLN